MSDTVIALKSGLCFLNNFFVSDVKLQTQSLLTVFHLQTTLNTLRMESEGLSKPEV